MICVKLNLIKNIREAKNQKEIVNWSRTRLLALDETKIWLEMIRNFLLILFENYD